MEMENKQRTPEAAAAYALTHYGISGALFEELRRTIIDHDESAISMGSWFHLDAVGLVGPSGHLMADAISIFWREE